MRSDEEDEVRGELRTPEEVIFVSIQRSKKNKSVTLGTVVVGGCVDFLSLPREPDAKMGERRGGRGGGRGGWNRHG